MKCALDWVCWGDRRVEEEAPHRPESHQGDTEPLGQEEAYKRLQTLFVPY